VISDKLESVSEVYLLCGIGETASHFYFLIFQIRFRRIVRRKI